MIFVNIIWVYETQIAVGVFKPLSRRKFIAMREYIFFTLWQGFSGPFTSAIKAFDPLRD